MLKTILTVAAVLAIAFGGGIWSTDFILDRFGGFGELRIGQWNAYPASGTVNADPYAKARAARKAFLPMGVAEGLPFYTREDSSGQKLQRGCDYELSGSTPVARFWTIHAAGIDQTPLEPRTGLHSALNSRNVIYDEKGNVTINISPNASTGNWLPVDGQGEFILAMTLYDTPASSSSGLSDMTMPTVKKLPGGQFCRG